ncbi:hypothetical protein [Tropicimonas sp. IMCC34011]|uniref:hypothetical protein n=1 Tax=Tropicimonas sp. IMCC34011 TaxID=2248759 RepID=UPI000E2586E7|nr:hypothetical protein [Tropicimonas sp. IMCC34011]
MVLALGAALGGCTASAPDTSVARAPSGPPLVLAPDGLRAGATGMEIGFGRTEASTVTAASRLVGARPVSVRDVSCGGPARAYDWAGGLTAIMRGGAFLGWSYDRSGTPVQTSAGDRSDAPALIGSDAIRVAPERLSAGLACA